jgi:ParB-like chromosome segregation protein Spo0J
MNKIEHVKVPIDKIILLEENPRAITDADLQKLSEDIIKDPSFLYQRPSLINFKDGKYYCYAGTQRIKAQKLLGETEAICFVENNISLELQRERMLRDNLHRGKWDSAKLMELDFNIDELENIGFDFDELNIDTDLFSEPEDLTSEMKNNPPTLKLVFQDEKQMSEFIKSLDVLLDPINNEKFEGINYSVSLGEL